jgi:hypothetical protein
MDRILLRVALGLFAVAGVCSGTAISQPSPPVVAIASGSDLSFYDVSGKVVRHIDLKHPVAGFAFAPDRSKLVVVSPDTEHGGALILIDLKTGSRRKLTSSRFAFKALEAGESEVYDSPAFSPEGRSLAFAVHGNLPGDGNDAWENSGPLAILDLDDPKPRVLEATNHVAGEGDDGPCSESDPQWSADGMWILFNCEDGAFLTDPHGRRLRNLKIGADDAGSSAVGWVGRNCILYVQTPETQGRFDFDHERVKLLNLKTLRSSDASSLLSGFSGPHGGLRRASGDVLIRQVQSRLIIQTRIKRWELPLSETTQEPQTVSAQLLTGWSPRSIPAGCN